MTQVHDLVTGDVTKFTDLIKEQGLYGKVLNDKPVLISISTNDVKEIEAQRDTASKWAYDCIVKRGGLDNSVFEPINVIEEDGVYYCYDGLGRLCIHQMMGFDTIDAWVSKGTQEEAAARFSWKNKKGIRSVNPESIFSADVSAKEPDALDEQDILAKVGLCVRVRTDKVIPDASTDPQIKIAGFRKAMKFADNNLDTLSMARDMIVNAYPDDNFIRADLFVGLVILLDTYEVLQRPGKPYDQLSDFLNWYGEALVQHRLPFKKNGGNQHNKENESVAYGLLKTFTNSKQCQLETSKHIRHKILLDRFELNAVKDI